MNALLAILLLAAPEPGWMKQAMWAEVLVVAEAVEVHPAKDGLRYVRYRMDRTLLGVMPSEQFEVGHPPDHEIKPGSRLILILDPDETVGPKSPWATEGVPTLFARETPIPAAQESEEEIDNALLGNLLAGSVPYGKAVKVTPIVAVAEVLEVGTPPGIWMGSIIPSTQNVQYKVVEVLKGELKAEKIEVGYFMIGNMRTTDTPDGKPGLTPSIFKPGNRLILLLTEGNCVENMTGPGPDSGLPIYCSGDVQYGAVPANEEYLAKARNALK